MEIRSKIVFVSICVAVASLGSVNASQFSSDTNCIIKSCSSPTPSNSSHLYTFCIGRNRQVHNRCCLENNITVGYDLSDCSITNVYKIRSQLPITNLSLVEFLILDQNPIKTSDCNVSAFQGFTSLTYLELPASCDSCPGKEVAWRLESYVHNTSSSDAYIVCEDQQSYCQYRVDVNETCPLSSTCRDAGPGSTLCVCNGTSTGYKCSFQDGFPWLTLSLSFAGATILLSALLYLSERRLEIKSRSISTSQNAAGSHVQEDANYIDAILGRGEVGVVGSSSAVITHGSSGVM